MKTLNSWIIKNKNKKQYLIITKDKKQKKRIFMEDIMQKFNEAELEKLNSILTQRIKDITKIRKCLTKSIKSLNTNKDSLSIKAMPKDIQYYKNSLIVKMEEELCSANIMLSFFEKAREAETPDDLIRISEKVIKENITN
jgi:hypothetical protein